MGFGFLSVKAESPSCVPLGDGRFSLSGVRQPHTLQGGLGLHPTGTALHTWWFPIHFFLVLHMQS